MICLIFAASILIFACASQLTYQARIRIRAHQRQLRDTIEQAEQAHADTLHDGLMARQDAEDGRGLWEDQGMPCLAQAA